MAAHQDVWSITAQERAKFEEQFRTLNPVNGNITGEQATGFLLRSGLPPPVLGIVWALADRDSDGKLDISEFSIACKLITLKLQEIEIPNVLPPSLLYFPSCTPPAMMSPAGVMREISYAGLNSYEFSILSRRPLVECEVRSLWQSTLLKFLKSNRFDECKRTDEKENFVKMIMKIEAEERSHQHQEQCSPQVSTGTLQTNDYNVHNIPVESSSVNINETSSVSVEPRNALLCNLDDSDDENWVHSEHACNVLAEQLLENVSYGNSYKQFLGLMMTRTIADIVSFLQCFGVQVDGSVCRIELLHLLRDVLEEYFVAKHSVPDQSGAASQNTPGASNAGPAMSATPMAQFTQEFGQMMSQPEARNEEPKKESSSDATDSNAHDSNSCFLCVLRPREIAFVPCGHTLCCRGCSRKLKECPVCRKKILRRLKLFFS